MERIPYGQNTDNVILFPDLTQNLVIRNHYTYCVGIINDKNTIELKADHSFLTLRVNQGKIIVSGRNNVIVLHRNYGEIQVKGQHNIIIVIDKDFTGAVSTKRADVNFLNFVDRYDPPHVNHNLRVFNSSLENLFDIVNRPNDRNTRRHFRELADVQAALNPSTININPREIRIADLGFFDDAVDIHPELHREPEQRLPPISQRRSHLRSPQNENIQVVPQPPAPEPQQRNQDRRSFRIESNSRSTEPNRNENSERQRAVSANRANQIKEVKVKAKPSTTEDSCVICCETLVNGSRGSAYLNCMHWFHATCISQWFGTDKTNCPSCRIKVKTLYKVTN